MLATVLHCMRGTPYVYQGEEIGMTNAYFHDISQYRDVESTNFYDILKKEGRSKEVILHILQERSRDNARTPMQWNSKQNAGFTDGTPWLSVIDVESTNFYDILKKEGRSKEEILHILQERSRDNARTPMQWNSKQNAGFTDGTPWLSVIDNYKTVNVENALQDENSVFYHYQKLIRIRKEYKVIQDGLYIPLLQDHKTIFAYKRKGEEGELIVLSNFYVEAVRVEIKENLTDYELLLSNYKDSKADKCITLRPYESVIYYKAS